MEFRVFSLSRRPSWAYRIFRGKERVGETRSGIIDDCVTFLRVIKGLCESWPVLRASRSPRRQGREGSVIVDTMSRGDLTMLRGRGGYDMSSSHDR